MLMWQPLISHQSMSHGWSPWVGLYFSEVGTETPDAPSIPPKHGPIKSKNFVIQEVGDLLRLKELGTYHFMMAGPEGAIVEEWASYHDGAGLRFTNQNAGL